MPLDATARIQGLASVAGDLFNAAEHKFGAVSEARPLGSA
jgi:hypothetical protein